MCDVKTNNGKTSEDSIPSDHSNQHNPEVLLLVGSAMWLVMPQIICFVYGGIVDFIISSVSILIGVIVGVIMYNHFPYRVTSCFNPAELPAINSRNHYAKPSWVNTFTKVYAR